MITKKFPDILALEKCKSDVKFHISSYNTTGKIDCHAFPDVFLYIQKLITLFFSFFDSNASFVSSMPVVWVTAFCE